MTQYLEKRLIYYSNYLGRTSRVDTYTQQLTMLPHHSV